MYIVKDRTITDLRYCGGFRGAGTSLPQHLQGLGVCLPGFINRVTASMGLRTSGTEGGVTGGQMT